MQSGKSYTARIRGVQWKINYYENIFMLMMTSKSKNFVQSTAGYTVHIELFEFKFKLLFTAQAVKELLVHIENKFYIVLSCIVFMKMATSRLRKNLHFL